MMMRPQTTEEITWQGTIKSILALTLVQALLRLFVGVVLFISWVLLTGRGAGPLLVGAAAIVATGLRMRSFIPPEPRVKTGKLSAERANTAVITGLLGIVLIGLWLTGYWPQLWWELGERRLWVAWATGSCSVPVIWLWIRLSLIVTIPWSTIRPFKDTDWALAIERMWPKAREVQFGQAQAIGKAIQHPRAGRQLRYNQTQQPPQLVVPTVQQPHAPDNTPTMKVDGV